MEESRISKIEKDLAVMNVTQRTMSDSLSKISVSLEKISDTHSDVRLLTEKISTMDREVGEAFGRHDNRVTKIEGIISKLTWMVIAPIIAAIIGLAIAKV